MSQYEYGDYNKGGLIAFAASMIFTLAFFIYIALVYDGVDLGEVSSVVPGELTPEKFDPSAVTDPWVSTEGIIQHGQTVYTMQCAVCHGPSGKGDGVAGASLVPPPRNLVEGKWKHGGTSIELFKTISEGFGPGSSMVSFAHLPVVDRWALVHYIRSITEDLVPDDQQALEAFGKTTVQ
jgi:mono/diheme cytochrome c family protein